MSREKRIKNFPVILIVVFLLLSIVSSFLVISNKTEYQVTVTEKENVRSSESSKYLVFTELDNGETKVFQNTDQWLVGKFNSSDFQGDLKIGNEYKVDTIGFRIPIFSVYENIVGYELLEEADE